MRTSIDQDLDSTKESILGRTNGYVQDGNGWKVQNKQLPKPKDFIFC